MQGVRVGDDHRVELLGVQHGCGARDTSGSSNAPSTAAGSATAASTAPARRSDELDVLAPHEAGADDADANGRGLGCGHGASLRRRGGVGPNRAYGTMDRRARTRSIQRRSPRPAPRERMFHSTGHRFANRTKSVRVSTATGPQLDSVVDDDLAPCEDVSTGCRAAAIECHVPQARRRAHNRGESHGHSPIDAPRQNRRVGARSNRPRRHRLRRRRRHPGEHRHRSSRRRTNPSRSASRRARTRRRRTTTAASSCSRSASRRPTSASPSSCTRRASSAPTPTASRSSRPATSTSTCRALRR